MSNKDQVLELFEKRHSDNRLSSVEENFLEGLGLTIENNGSTVDIIKDGKVLIGLTDYRSAPVTSKDWDEFEKKLANIEL